MAGYSDKELEAMRRSTQQLIERYPTTIVLNRPPEAVADGFGGFKRGVGTDTAQRPRQRFIERIIDQVRHGGFADVTETPMGRFYLSHILVGLPGDDIREGDWFELNGEKIVVIKVDPQQDWQVKASCGLFIDVRVPLKG